jgi:hypothetical protein
MRLGRLTADATIVFDGDVDVASKPVARPTGLLPGRLPASVFATPHFAPAPETALPPHSLTMPDQVSNI